jgi:hypothetical protein
MGLPKVLFFAFKPEFVTFKSIFAKFVFSTIDKE